MLSEQIAIIPALSVSAPPANPSRHNTLAWLFSAVKLWVILATGRGGMLLNHVRVTHEHLSSQDNTDAIPPGKLTSIYLQNTVGSLPLYHSFPQKREVSLYTQQQSGPCIPKLRAGSKRSVQVTQWHFTFAITKDPFCLSVLNTA